MAENDKQASRVPVMLNLSVFMLLGSGVAGFIIGIITGGKYNLVDLFLFVVKIMLLFFMVYSLYLYWTLPDEAPEVQSNKTKSMKLRLLRGVGLAVTILTMVLSLILVGSVAWGFF